jgi:hypothetical protein
MRYRSRIRIALYGLGFSLFCWSSATRADITIETFDAPNYNPELIQAFADPSNTITAGATNWTIDQTTSSQSDYYGLARSFIEHPVAWDISTETTLEFSFSLNQQGSYGTEVFVALEDLFGGANVYKGIYGLGDHLFKVPLDSPTFQDGGGADLTELLAVQIRAISFAPPPGGGPGAVSAPLSMTFKDLKATSPAPANPAVVTDFNNVGVNPGYGSWGTATITTGPESLRVVSSGFGGAPAAVFSSLQAGGNTHAELDVTINSSDAPVNIIALLEDADGTQNVWRWAGLDATNGSGGGSNHILGFRMDTVTTSTYDATPVLIDNANSWQTVFLDNTPGDLTDNEVLDLDNLVNFHIQVEPLLGVRDGTDTINYDVSFNNLSVVDASGSFDTDYDADGRDFLLWQRGLSPNALIAADLAEWKANFGGALSAVQSVPEPTSGCLLLASILAAGSFQRSSRQD